MSAETNRALIERLYDALDRGDGEAMTACYAEDARFEDRRVRRAARRPVSAPCRRMLTSRATDPLVELPSHDADEDSGSVNWVATYTFTATGRGVVNDIQASFQFRDGLIVDHLDQFSFRRWASQAFGPARQRDRVAAAAAGAGAPHGARAAHRVHGPRALAALVQLLEQALPRLFVVPEALEPAAVPDPPARGMVVADLDHQLRPQLDPLEVAPAGPAARLGAAALARLQRRQHRPHAAFASPALKPEMWPTERSSPPS